MLRDELSNIKNKDCNLMLITTPHLICMECLLYQLQCNKETIVY